MTAQADITDAHCNTCCDTRKHHVLFAHRESWCDEEVGANGATVYELLKCCGCGRVCMRSTDWCSEVCDDFGRPEASITYHPNPTSRRMPTWMTSGVHGIYIWHDHFISRYLNEIYSTLFSKAYALSTMGIRALLEQVMVDLVGDQGSFKKTLTSFKTAGHIGETQRRTLENTLELGHATMHRGFKPTQADTEIALGIVEGIIESIYIHSPQAENLRRRVPERKKGVTVVPSSGEKS